MSNPLIIHHQGCSDGICGALVLWLGLGKKAEVLSAQYGDDPPDDEQIKDRDVWIVDFSYPRDTLLHMNEVASNLIVLDHHETAKNNCEGLDFATFDMGRSGSRLAFDKMTELGWDDLDNIDVLEQLVDYVQDRDLWQWKLVGSKEVSAWLSSWPRDLETWQQILNFLITSPDSEPTLPNAVSSYGTAILRSQDQQKKSLVAGAWPAVATDVPGFSVVKCMIVNSPILQSEVGEKLAKTPGCDMGVCWFQKNDGEYVYSLRSQNDFDTSVFAQHFGGGGHKAASGFTSTQSPEEIFTRLQVNGGDENERT